MLHNFREIIPSHGRTIQVSELLKFKPDKIIPREYHGIAQRDATSSIASHLGKPQDTETLGTTSTRTTTQTGASVLERYWYTSNRNRGFTHNMKYMDKYGLYMGYMGVSENGLPPNLMVEKHQKSPIFRQLAV
jgi:hypothetical protein